MPLGKKYSVEEQLTGQESIGGMQLEIAPRYKTSVLFARAKTSEEYIKCPSEEALDLPLDLFSTPSEAGFLPGQFLFMHRLDEDWHYRPQHRKFNWANFPEKEFFGATLQKEHNFYQYARPTFVRELMAWCAPDTSSGEYKLEVVSPIPVPITWKGQYEYNPSSSMLRLSPFIDIRYFSSPLLAREAEMQHDQNLPKDLFWYTIKSAKPLKQPESSYMPLYSLAKDEIVLHLVEIRIAGSWEPYRMALSPGAARKQSIIESKDRRMFAWERSQVINIHIFNSVAFTHITGLTTLPSPVSFEKYAASRLPFYTDHRKGLEVGHGPMSSVSSVQQMDVTAGVVWDVVIAATKDLTGCAFCEINLADTL
jgi:hypothetical protein